MQLLIHPLLFLAACLLMVERVLGFFLIIRLVRLRWPHRLLIALDSTGTFLVRLFMEYLQKVIKPFDHKNLPEGYLLVIGLILLALLETLLVALLNHSH